MRKQLITLVLIITGILSYAQGIKFEHSSWDAVLKKAKEEKKIVFIDFYTSWCGPCKHMSTEIFTQDTVGKYFNENFINYKIDAEKGEGPKIASKFKVSAYPTFVFVNDKGELVYRFLGGRSVDALIAEGEKALVAYANRGKLKKMNKKYESGNRNLKFLNDYFGLKSSMGLDCGQVLIDYFSLISDEELLKEENADKVEKMTKFDSKIYNRLVNGIIELSKTKDKKEFSKIGKATLKSLSVCVASAANGDREQEFEEILELKERLAAVSPNNSVISASLGGGMIYLPVEQLRLNYYTKQHKDQKFKKTAIEYFYKLIREREELVKSNALVQDAFSEQLEKAKKSGKSESEIKTIKKMGGMIGAFSAITDKYNAAQIANATEHYWNITPDKTEELKKVCKDWSLFAYELDKTPDVAIACAEMLVKLGCKDEAVKMLEEVVVVAVGATMVTEKDIEKASEKLEKIKAL